MTSQDWAGLIMASNESAMQWYSLVSQKPLPTTGNVLTVSPTGVQVGTASGGMVTILVLGVLAYLIFKR